MVAHRVEDIQWPKKHPEGEATDVMVDAFQDIDVAADAARQTCEHLSHKYMTLFNFSPIGYMMLNRDGLIQDVNLSASILVDAPRSKLIGRRFIDFVHRDDRDGFRNQKRCCQGTLGSRVFELKIKKIDGSFFDARLQMQSFSANLGDEPQYSVSLMDISEQVLLSANVMLQQRCLELACMAEDLPALLRGCVQLVKSYLQCDAVGIRLRDDAGNIPYQAFDGFSREFYESESMLCLNTDQCLCISVIKGATDPGQPIFTVGGSFYTNGTSRLFAAVPPVDLGPTRNVCPAHGYESLALVPVVVDKTIDGLIQVADRRENRFPLRTVEALEQVASRLGLAIHHFTLQERLLQSRKTLDELSKHLLTMQEEEQRRIALELHDGCGQNLNVLKLRLKGLQRNLPSDASALAGECNLLMTLTDNILDEIRTIAHGLKPSTLETLGLVPATRQMIRDFSNQNNVYVEKCIDLLDRIDHQTVQVCLYRIFQEALTNIHKHARATWVLFAVKHENQTLCITIKDNGIGFDDRKSFDASNGGKGMGLHAMALRCRMIDADLNIDSQPGTGSRLRICLSCP
jgi:PAS domain S-box-containing protein